MNKERGLIVCLYLVVRTLKIITSQEIGCEDSGKKLTGLERGGRRN